MFYWLFFYSPYLLLFQFYLYFFFNIYFIKKLLTNLNFIHSHKINSAPISVKRYMKLKVFKRTNRLASKIFVSNKVYQVFELRKRKSRYDCVWNMKFDLILLSGNFNILTSGEKAHNWLCNYISYRKQQKWQKLMYIYT